MSEINASKCIIKIDRSKPFDVQAVLGPDWSIVEQDARALSITELDLSKVILQPALLRAGEEYRIPHQENIRRLKEDNTIILLDIVIFFEILKRENQKFIPKSWYGHPDLSPRIYFDGTTLSCSFHPGQLYVKYISPISDTEWMDGGANAIVGPNSPFGGDFYTPIIKVG